MLRAMLLILCLALPARAATVSDVSLPDTYPIGGQTLVLNGLGIRTVTFLRIRAYVAGLYLSQRSSDERSILTSPGPKVVLMQYLHSATKSQVDDHYREGEEHNCGRGECAADAADFQKLVAATPAAAVGDTLTFIFDGRGVRALANNRQIADIANRDLADRLLAGFIGATPPSEDLKARLLGRKSG